MQEIGEPFGQAASVHGKLDIGVIGCGVGGLHLEGLATNPRVDVVAVAGLDEDRCRMLATKYAIPKVYRDYHDLIVDPEIDAVTVAVPNILHAPVAMDALQARGVGPGVHVGLLGPTSRSLVTTMSR